MVKFFEHAEGSLICYVPGKKNWLLTETTGGAGQLNNMFSILLQSISGSAAGYPKAGSICLGLGFKMNDYSVLCDLAKHVYQRDIKLYSGWSRETTGLRSGITMLSQSSYCICLF